MLGGPFHGIQTRWSNVLQQKDRRRNESKKAALIIRVSQKQSPACFSLHRWQGKENVLFFWDINRTSVKMIKDVRVIFLWISYHWVWHLHWVFLIFYFALLLFWPLGDRCHINIMLEKFTILVEESTNSFWTNREIRSLWSQQNKNPFS